MLETMTSVQQRRADLTEKFSHLLSVSGIAESSRYIYVGLLKNIWTKALNRRLVLDELPDRNWVYAELDVIKAWVLQHGKLTTQRNYLTVLMLVCKTTDRYDELQRLMCEMNRAYNDMETEQSMDSKEVMFSKPHEELCNIVEMLKQKVYSLSAVKAHRPMTHEEAFGEQDGWIKLFEYLALLVMVHQPPVRGDWGCVKRSHTPHQNYIDCQHLIIKHDKVAGLYGTGHIPLNDNVYEQLKMSFQVWPRLYVFPNKFDPGMPMGVCNFTRFLRHICHPVDGVVMNQGVQLLRSSYITWFYDDRRHTLKDKEKLAKCMRHSQQIAEKSYRKL